MASPEHLAKLKEGVEAWNRWRAENSDVVPDLRQVDLRDAKLHNANLYEADLSQADLSLADLSGANLLGTTLVGANLGGTNLLGASLNIANLGRANLSRANLGAADLCRADFYKANLGAADLHEAHLFQADLGVANLREANLRGADLREAVLREADLRGTDLRTADLDLANLSLANLGDANLGLANLSRANLSDSNFSGANLGGANLGAAKLRQANLPDADLREANLSAADLSKANLSRAAFGNTYFGGTRLNGAIGLDSCQHSGPSYLDYFTLQLSWPLPLPFLRGCGLPDQYIDYLPSLLNQAIQFYSCFISYSTEDQKFADRLYADLQNKGVRCWFAPHDLQGGKKIHEQIEEAIRVYERLLLIISEDSMSSRWVKTEIANARKKQLEQKRRVLFPVRLVSFEAIRAWKLFDADVGDDAAGEIREYFIPDFTHWKDHDSYTKAFDRLLRDLKAQPAASASP